MLEELNNILDRTNNWIVFEEARNSGLIALNLGLISFIFDKLGGHEKFLLSMCIISIMVCAYSFIQKRLPFSVQIVISKNWGEEKKENRNKLEKINSYTKKEEIHTEKESLKEDDALFTDSRIIVRKHKKDTEQEDKPSKKDETDDLSQYTSKNIYNYEDMAKINEETLLLLVHERLLKRNEKEEYPLNISKDYQFKLAHRDLSEMIHHNSHVCLIKSRCFFISLGIFIINIMTIGVLFVIR